MQALATFFFIFSHFVQFFRTKCVPLHEILYNKENSFGEGKFVGKFIKISNMSKFYILMVILLVIAIINLARALKEKKSSSKVLGVTINAVVIVLLLVAVVISFIQ